MKHLLAPAAISLAVLASPAAALDFGDTFRVTGDLAVGYDSYVNAGTMRWNTALGVPLSFGGVEVEIGLRNMGLTKTDGTFVFTNPRRGLYASIRGEHWGLHVGMVKHATDAYLPDLDLYRSPFGTIAGPGNVSGPFGPMLRYEKWFIPSSDVVIRAEVKYKGFLLSYSRSDKTPYSSVYASYDFDVAKVFAGADYSAGILRSSYFGAEGSIGKFDLSGMVITSLGTPGTNLSVSYNVNDKFSIGAVSKSVSGGVHYWSLNADYQITDMAKASVGYTKVGSFNFTSAQISVDLN